jgi:hypothetical protein
LNTVYTTGYQTGDGSITIEFYTNPTFKFSCTKSIQNLTVPLGYNYMYVDMSGAAAGSGGIGTPGYGARVQSYFSVIPGLLLHVSVGCQGASCPSSPVSSGTFFSGGFNGGGVGYGNNNNVGGTGGGGASDVRVGGISLSDRVGVAGGGGGYFCGSFCGALKGGDGDRFGHSGTYSSNSACTSYSNNPGGGATSVSGGIAGYDSGSPHATPGIAGYGGNGGYANSGGGGGGYYGGKTEELSVFIFVL